MSEFAKRDSNVFILLLQTPVRAKSRDGSSDANDSPHQTPSKKKPNKLLQRLKKRNKTAPMPNDGVSRSPSLSLSGVPPLRAPWVSEDMELEQEFIPSPSPPPSTQGGRIVKRGSPLLGLRLPKLANQPASSASDISQLPVLTGEIYLLYHGTRVFLQC